MSARFDLVTIDSPDTERLAAFWCAALYLHEVEREDGDRWLVLADDTGVRRIGLQRGMHRPGGIHLDLVCDVEDFAAELARLERLGAVVSCLPRIEPYGRIANLADPDGNAFDVCAYANEPAPEGTGS
jgi:predicted enzyme related to lactoylglutathione lyase